MVGGERRYHASGFRYLPDSNISAWFSILRISNDTSPDVDFSGVGIAVPRRGSGTSPRWRWAFQRRRYRPWLS